MFSFFKKQSPVKPDIMAPWNFGASKLPTMVVGDDGSAKSEVLLEIAKQSMSAGKVTFYFTLKGDTNSLAKMHDAAVQSGYSDRFYAANHFYDSITATAPAALEPVCFADVLAHRGAAFVGFMALSRAVDEVREEASSLMRECLEVVLSTADTAEVLVLVDDVEFLSPEIMDLLKLAAKKVDVVLGVHSHHALHAQNLFESHMPVVLLRSRESAKWAELLSTYGVVLNGNVSQLEPGNGYRMLWAKGAAESIVWSMNPAPRQMEIVSANKPLLGEHMSILTKDEIEEARAQLTFDAFVAHFVCMHVGRPMPLWLCTTDEAQAGAKAVAQAEFSKWVSTELEMLERRAEGDPFTPKIVVNNE